MKISGLDKLQRNLKEAQTALSELDGDLGSVSFNPNDPASIERAIEEVARIVDSRVGAHASNPIVRPIAEQLKSKYREQILERAAAMRLGSTKPDDK